jgi:hypothetical protein
LPTFISPAIGYLLLLFQIAGWKPAPLEMPRSVVVAKEPDASAPVVSLNAGLTTGAMTGAARGLGNQASNGSEG